MSRAITYATDSRRLAATPCAVLCLTGVVGGTLWAMTNPQGPNTAILTYLITAQQLYEMRTHLPLPLFISEGDPKVDPNRGWHEHCLGWGQP